MVNRSWPAAVVRPRVIAAAQMGDAVMLRNHKCEIENRGSALAGGDRVRRFPLAPASIPRAPDCGPGTRGDICAGRYGGEDQPHCSDRGDLVLHPSAWE
jgi:hypothetical protein